MNDAENNKQHGANTILQIKTPIHLLFVSLFFHNTVYYERLRGSRCCLLYRLSTIVSAVMDSAYFFRFDGIFFAFITVPVGNVYGIGCGCFNFLSGNPYFYFQKPLGSIRYSYIAFRYKDYADNNLSVSLLP